MSQNIKPPLCATSPTSCSLWLYYLRHGFNHKQKQGAEDTRRNVTCGFMDKALQNWQKRSGERQKQYKAYLQKADKNDVLKQLPVLHEEAFEKIDCLQCANCC